jgi:hypothetical protein
VVDRTIDLAQHYLRSKATAPLCTELLATAFSTLCASEESPLIADLIERFYEVVNARKAQLAPEGGEGATLSSVEAQRAVVRFFTETLGADHYETLCALACLGAMQLDIGDPGWLGTIISAESGLDAIIPPVPSYEMRYIRFNIANGLCKTLGAVVGVDDKLLALESAVGRASEAMLSPDPALKPKAASLLRYILQQRVELLTIGATGTRGPARTKLMLDLELAKKLLFNAKQ